MMAIFGFLGSGSALILFKAYSRRTERSNIEVLALSGQSDRRKIRAIKSGRMAHLKTNYAQVKNGGWKQLAQADMRDMEQSSG